MPSQPPLKHPEKVICFHDNSSIANTVGVYETVTIDVQKVIESWKNSLFSYEWIGKDGFKSLEDLPEKDRKRRNNIEEKIANKQPIEKPILGIGVMDNIEIGSGRAVLLTLAIHGAQTLPVHIRISQKEFFTDFIARDKT